MPPRVTYWTGVWDPRKEAISKEIDALRVGRRRRAPVVAFAPGQTFRLALRERALVLPTRSWLALRGVAAAMEARGDVTHIFGGRFSWHLFRSLGRKPILLTAVASHAGPADIPATLAHIVVETESGIGEWTDAGYAPDRISVIPPGVDLAWYGEVSTPAPDRFTLLFASTPADPSEIEPRGIPLLIELARRRPDIDVLVPWRQWGDVDAGQRRLRALDPPSNFIAHFGDVPDMRSYFARAHATVACFAPGAGKSCPGFVIEGFAAGRPCLATPGGLSALIAAHGAGVVAERTAGALAQALDELRAGWSGYAVAARQLASREFDLHLFRRRYEALYEKLGAPRAAAAAP